MQGGLLIKLTATENRFYNRQGLKKGGAPGGTTTLHSTEDPLRLIAGVLTAREMAAQTDWFLLRIPTNLTFGVPLQTL